MAVDSLRRGRGFHKRRHRPNAVREEMKKAARTVVRDTVEPPLVRRQGKGKGGNGKGVAPPPPAPPPPPPDAPQQSTTSSSLTTSTAVTSVQTTQTSIQTQTTVITTAQTSTEVSTQVTTIMTMTMTLTSSMITSPLPTLQTSLSTAVTTTTPFVATTPYQAAPSSTTTSAAATRAPAIAPGTIAGIVVGILSFFFIVLGAVCLCSRRTRQRLLTPVTRRFTNNTLVNSGSRGLDSTGRRSGRGVGDMHKSLVSDAESMAFTAASPRDVKAPQPPQMAMVEPPRGLSQNPVFMGAGAAYPPRPNSWRTWRPSATFAQGLDPVPDDMQLPPRPPPHALTARYSGLQQQQQQQQQHPPGSRVSTGDDSSMPEYGAWPPMASNADLTALTPAPGQAVTALGPDRAQSREYFQQQGQGLGLGGEDGVHQHASYVTYSETPLATPRTPIVVEGEQLAPLATSQEASPVDNCDSDSGERVRDAGATGAGGGDIWWNEPARVGRSGSGKIITIGRDGRRVGGGGNDGGGGDKQPDGGIQEAQLGRQAGEGGGHGGGAQGVEAEPPREQGREQAEQGQPGEPGERGEQVFQEVAAVQGQRGLRASIRSRSRRSTTSLRAPSSWDGDESTRSGSSDAGFSWSEAASEPYTAAAPRDGFGLSIIGARHGSRSARTGEGAGPGPSTTQPDEDG
ncbi:hypothetical protein FJTKL_07225 [Diaporthe vaccinii]|uniref:Uncharacterized protein n=1 Tax=Diaporthe vaccinii TaxID=105482 RepID=A0ABR4EU44_9PEZI